MVRVIGESGEGRESEEMAYTAAPDGTGSVKLVPRPVESPEEEQQSANRPKTSEKPAATGQITVAWDSVPNASSYNIYWRTAPGVTKQNGTKITGIQSPYTFSGLKHGITYFFVVTSVSQTGESQASEEFSFSLPE